MKFTHYLFPIFFFLIHISCSDDDTDITIIDEIESLKKVQEITNDTHTIELYTDTGHFSTGYNDISLRIKNNSDNTYIENASLTWNPVMTMPTMKHSCPKSTISKVPGKNTLYNGYIIYQMTHMDMSGWTLNISYTINDSSYEAKAPLLVGQSNRQNVTTITGSDDTKYIIALIAPSVPKIAVNDVKIGVYTMEDAFSFPVVKNYSIALDPRMPSMGNHSSPNNEDLTYSDIDTMYHGRLSLTMSGYWVLNLKLINDQGMLLKGEDITTDHLQSSLYLEIEF